MILSEVLKATCEAYRGCWVSGLADTGGTTTVLISQSLIGEKILSGNFIQIEGTDYLITEYNQVVGSVTFTPERSTPVQSGNRFTVTPRKQKELISALTRVIQSTGDSWKVARLDESNEIIRIYEGGLYTLPNDCSNVSAVWIQKLGQLNDSGWENFPYWEVISDNGIRKLFVTSSFYGKIRIQYYSHVSIPNTIDDEISFGGANEGDAAAFVIQRMLYELYRLDHIDNITGEAGKQYKVLMEYHRTESERVRGNERISPVASRSRRQTRPRMKI